VLKSGFQNMSLRTLFLVLPLLGAPALPAAAQNYGLPPADVGGGGRGYTRAQTTDEANLLVRVDRLEEQVRQLTGQLEQMQFANKRLEDLLKKFQQDVDYRFQERGGRPQKRTEAEDVGAPPAVAADAAAPRPGRRGDAFDPSADPAAPGAPRTLGGGPIAAAPAGDPGYVRSPQAPIIVDDADPDAPLNLSGSRLRGANADAGAPQPGAPPRAPRVIPLGPATASTGADVTPGGTAIATSGPPSPREEFDVALGYLKEKQYENAERGFSTFIQKNPRNRLASDAYYYLGESYFQRGRQREAAEQYLKISTNYASSPRAPEAMLRLGQSLQALGAKEQACATFSEVSRKYPNASAAIKSGAEREAKRSQC
jgi:tol-pal system protein YbgF